MFSGDVGSWVLLVAPHESSWEHIADSFTRASRHFANRDDISVRIYYRSYTFNSLLYFLLNHLHAPRDFEVKYDNHAV